MTQQPLGVERQMSPFWKYTKTRKTRATNKLRYWTIRNLSTKWDSKPTAT